MSVTFWVDLGVHFAVNVLLTKIFPSGFLNTSIFKGWIINIYPLGGDGTRAAVGYLDAVELLRHHQRPPFHDAFHNYSHFFFLLLPQGRPAGPSQAGFWEKLKFSTKLKNTDQGASAELGRFNEQFTFNPLVPDGPNWHISVFEKRMLETETS